MRPLSTIFTLTNTPLYQLIFYLIYGNFEFLREDTHMEFREKIIWKLEKPYIKVHILPQKLKKRCFCKLCVDVSNTIEFSVLITSSVMLILR